MVVNVVGDLVLGPIYGISGIVAATTTGSLVLAAVLNGWLLHRRHAGLELRSTLAVLARSGALAAVATGAGFGVAALLADLALPPVLLCAALGITVCGVYVGGLVLLKAPERHFAAEALRTLRRRRK